MHANHFYCIWIFSWYGLRRNEIYSTYTRVAWQNIVFLANIYLLKNTTKRKEKGKFDFMLFSYGFSFLFFPLRIHDLNIAWMAANCKQWLLNFCLLWCYLCSVVAFDLLVGCLKWQFFLRDWNGKWGCDSYKVEACKLTERKTKKYVL